MKSSTLLHLLHLVWSNPVFGDSYPTAASEHGADVIRQVETLHYHFVSTLRPVLTRGMPQASAEEVDAIIRLIAPKSTAFCPAIAAGEIDDVERLRAVAVSIALSYWADWCMDRGDESMLAAVRWLGNGITNKYVTANLSMVMQPRLTALRWIEREIKTLSRPRDVPLLLACAYRDMLQNEAAVRELSRRYIMEGGGRDYWDSHAEALAKLSIANGGLLYVTSAIYAIYYQHYPGLPDLADVFEQPALMDVMRGPCNAAIRIFDDLGDRLPDSGRHPERGVFNINIFNQPKPPFVRAFLRRAGITDEAVFDSVLSALQANTQVGRNYVVQVFRELVRNRLADLPSSVWDKYSVYLKLCKRVIEAGYVNMMGDTALAEPQSDIALEDNLATPVSDKPWGRWAMTIDPQ